MNILPLVFALIFILSVLTIEKLEKFKSMMLVQHQYREAIQKQDRKVFNDEQELIYGSQRTSYRQLSFHPFINKAAREGANIEKYKQIRQITIDLIHVLYGHTSFFQKMEKRRPSFVEELLDAIQETTNEMPKGSIIRVQDVTRIKLEDPELQKVFYRMLKGTIEKDEYKSLTDPIVIEHEKTYLPFLTFLHNNDNGKGLKIELRHASREILLAIYGNQELVDKLIEMREVLSINYSSGKLIKEEVTEKFRSEFAGKQKQGITDDVLDYEMSQSLKFPYR